MSHAHAHSRRRFLAGTAALAAAGLPRWFIEESRAQPKPAEPASANDKIGIALIGCGGMGRGDAHNAQRFGNIVAVCDVDQAHIAEAHKYWAKADGIKDFRKVLERKDVDVVICATVDHWHTLVSMAAMKAGKDVYCEKPLTLTVDEGKHLVPVQRQTKRILQTGTQQRSDKNFRLACELVRNNRLGKLKHVSVWIPAGRREGPFKTSTAPDGFDYDMWLGQTPRADYVKERTHQLFRYWWEYSGGTITDWGAHHNDIALWATGYERSGPVQIDGKPLIDMIPGGFTATAQYQFLFTYANGVTHSCHSTTASAWNGQTLNAKGQTHGVRFEGTDGWLFVTRGRIEASRPEILSEPLPSNAIRLYASDDHMGNFFDCVRSRKAPICEAEIGHRSATLCHLAAASIRLGRKLQWDPAAERFVNDDQANAMLAREQRKPWTYEMV